LTTTANSEIGSVVEIELFKIDEDGATSMIMGSWQMGQADGAGRWGFVPGSGGTKSSVACVNASRRRHIYSVAGPTQRFRRWKGIFLIMIED
jgi:hypothetical protein